MGHKEERMGVEGESVLEHEEKQPPCQTFANLPVLVKLCFEGMFGDNRKGNNEMIWQGQFDLKRRVQAVSLTQAFLQPAKK